MLFIENAKCVSVCIPPLAQTQEGRAGEAHVRPAGEQTGADGAAGGAHEAAKGRSPSFYKSFVSARDKKKIPESALSPILWIYRTDMCLVK